MGGRVPQVSEGKVVGRPTDTNDCFVRSTNGYAEQNSEPIHAKTLECIVARQSLENKE